MTPAEPTPGHPARRRRSRSFVLTVVAIAALAAALTGTAVAAALDQDPPARPGPAPVPVAGAPSATAAVAAFFRLYVDPDGRVVRRDQGGDTVSEGQAYAMLMAAAVGDRAGFGAVWGWAQRNLLEADGLLAWRWSDGAVRGGQSASDADLGAAAALVHAGQRFSDPSLTTAATRMSAAIAAHEVGAGPSGPVLLAGPWAVAPTEYVNPSYLMPAELSALAAAEGGPWPALAADAGADLARLTAGGTLPSDWAVTSPQSGIHPAAPPGDPASAVVFGFDAARVPIWMATSCDPADRSAGAGLLPALQRGGGRVDLDLGGGTGAAVASPVGLLSRAGAEWAAGDRDGAWRLIGSAEQADQAHSTYYGRALSTLATLSFEGLLGGCP